MFTLKFYNKLFEIYENEEIGNLLQETINNLLIIAKLLDYKITIFIDTYYNYKEYGVKLDKYCDIDIYDQQRDPKITINIDANQQKLKTYYNIYYFSNLPNKENITIKSLIVHLQQFMKTL